MEMHFDFLKVKIVFSNTYNQNHLINHNFFYKFKIFWLDLIVDSSDFRTGLLAGSATAPKPLTHEEFEIVKTVEDARVRQHLILFVWSLTGFESKFNVIFLDVPNGVQVSLRARLNYKAYRNDRIPISNFPPKATEIAINKIWNEFEKVEFIQKATLKKK